MVLSEESEGEEEEEEEDEDEEIEEGNPHPLVGPVEEEGAGHQVRDIDAPPSFLARELTWKQCWGSGST